MTATNFVVEVEFKISGESSHLFGDGFAIWLTKGRAEPGPVFGNIGAYMRLERDIALRIFLGLQINLRDWVFSLIRELHYKFYTTAMLANRKYLSQLRQLPPPLLVPPHCRDARRWQDLLRPGK